MRKTFLVAIVTLITCGLTACGTSTEIEKTGTDITEQVIEETAQEENTLVEDTIAEDVNQQPEEDDEFDWHTCTNEELLNHVFSEEEMLEILIEGAN